MKKNNENKIKKKELTVICPKKKKSTVMQHKILKY